MFASFSIFVEFFLLFLFYPSGLRWKNSTVYRMAYESTGESHQGLVVELFGFILSNLFQALGSWGRAKNEREKNERGLRRGPFLPRLSRPSFFLSLSFFFAPNYREPGTGFILSDVIVNRTADLLCESSCFDCSRTSLPSPSRTFLMWSSL